MLKIVFERMFDLINANKKGIFSSGGGVENMCSRVSPGLQKSYLSKGCNVTFSLIS